MVDYALRRRFAFHRLRPAFASERFWAHLLARGVAEEVERARSRGEALAEQLISLAVRAAGLPKREVYANLARISHSPADIVIDFAHLLPGEGSANVRSRVVMTPLSAKLLLRALTSQDMYLAGSFILLLSTMTVIELKDLRRFTAAGLFFPKLLGGPGTRISARRRSSAFGSRRSTRQKSTASPTMSSVGWRRPRRSPGAGPGRSSAGARSRVCGEPGCASARGPRSDHPRADDRR